MKNGLNIFCKQADSSGVDTCIPSGVPQATWDRARRHLNALGPVPSLFSACVRAVGKVEAVFYPIDNEGVRELAVASAEFLVGTSPTLKSVFYWARKSLYPTSQETAPLDVPTLLLPFTPREIASIIGVTYLYRRCSKLCPEDEWPRLGRKVRVQSALGHLLGSHMELVGSGTGLILGATRPIALATMAISKPEDFKRYRHALKKGANSFDMALEEEIFGCNHLHISSLVVQALGFCLPRSPLSMSLGMDAMNVKEDVLPVKLRAQLLSLKAACSAIDFASRTGNFRAEGDGYELFLPPGQEATLVRDVKEIVHKGGFEWLEKRPDELSNEIQSTLDGAGPRGLDD